MTLKKKKNKDVKMRKERGDWQARGWNNLKPEHLCRLCSTHVDRSYWDQEPRFGNRAREGWKMAVLKLSFTPAYGLSLEMRRESPWTAQRQVLEILMSVFSAMWSSSQFIQPWPAWQWEGRVFIPRNTLDPLRDSILISLYNTSLR